MPLSEMIIVHLDLILNTLLHDHSHILLICSGSVRLPELNGSQDHA